MRVTIYKDPLAIRFIRCVSPIPGFQMNAGGAALTLPQAIAKCESEIIERTFELTELRPNNIHPIGIAAHISQRDANEKALQEATETLCLKQIKTEKRIRCIFKLKVFNISLGVARTSSGYFALIIGSLLGERIAAHSAAQTLTGCLLKAWEEYRSMHFFKPSLERLKNFTKANILFSADELKNLPFNFEPGFVYQPQISGLKSAHAERSGRHIVYLYNEIGGSL